MSRIDATLTHNYDHRFRQRLSLAGRIIAVLAVALISLFATGSLRAGEADLAIPDLRDGKFNIFGFEITAWNLLFYGAFVICGTLGISIYQYLQIMQQPVQE